MDSNKKLLFASYGIKLLAVINIIQWSAAVYFIDSQYKVPIAPVFTKVAALLIAASILVAMLYVLTAKRLLALKQTAWKHAMILSVVMMIDVWSIIVAAFVIYCLMDKNVRLQFKQLKLSHI